MKKIVRNIIRVFIFLPRIIIVPLLAVGYWSVEENNMTYMEALKDSWKYSDI